MHRVATPFGAQRLGRQVSDASEKEADTRPETTLPTRPQQDADTPAKLPNSRTRTMRVVGMLDGVAKKTKPSSKRPSSQLSSRKRQAGAEDTGRFHPLPAKRCKRTDAGGEEPTDQMRSMQAQVINLARRPDRMDGCSERLRLNCPWLQHQRFEATDGKNEVFRETEVVSSWNTASNVVYQKKRAIRKGWNDLDSYQVRQLVLSAGERGCALSHIRAWRYCLERAGATEQPLLVLEDDAAPTPQFTSVLRRALAALPSDAHLLYLGYSQAADWRREMSENLVESEYVWTTVGYIVWPAGARILLSKLPVDGPVDNWMAGLCAAGDVKAYAVRPKIVLQADAWNVNSDVAHSDEHYWGPSSDIHHSDAFYWGNPDIEHVSNGQGPKAPVLHGSMDRSNTIWANLDEDSEDSEDSVGDDL